eukprot:765465-Pelagomonas_calceolata.AAC.1
MSSMRRHCGRTSNGTAGNPSNCSMLPCQAMVSCHGQATCESSRENQGVQGDAGGGKGLVTGFDLCPTSGHPGIRDCGPETRARRRLPLAGCFDTHGFQIDAHEHLPKAAAADVPALNVVQVEVVPVSVFGDKGSGQQQATGERVAGKRADWDKTCKQAGSNFEVEKSREPAHTRTRTSNLSPRPRGMRPLLAPAFPREETLAAECCLHLAIEDALGGRSLPTAVQEAHTAG